jgi:hypothetical protein
MQKENVFINVQLLEYQKEKRGYLIKSNSKKALLRFIESGTIETEKQPAKVLICQVNKIKGGHSVLIWVCG